MLDLLSYRRGRREFPAGVARRLVNKTPDKRTQVVTLSAWSDIHTIITFSLAARPPRSRDSSSLLGSVSGSFGWKNFWEKLVRGDRSRNFEFEIKDESGGGTRAKLSQYWFLDHCGGWNGPKWWDKIVRGSIKSVLKHRQRWHNFDRSVSTFAWATTSIEERTAWKMCVSYSRDAPTALKKSAPWKTKGWRAGPILGVSWCRLSCWGWVSPWGWKLSHKTVTTVGPASSSRNPVRRNGPRGILCS